MSMTKKLVESFLMKIHKLMLNTFLELKNKLLIFKKQKTVVMQLIIPQLMLELSSVKINKENLMSLLTQNQLHHRVKMLEKTSFPMN